MFLNIRCGEEDQSGPMLLELPASVPYPKTRRGAVHDILRSGALGLAARVLANDIIAAANKLEEKLKEVK